MTNPTYIPSPPAVGPNVAGGAFLPTPGTEPTPDLSDVLERVAQIEDGWATPELRQEAERVSRAHRIRRDAATAASAARDQYTSALAEGRVGAAAAAWQEAAALEAVAADLPAPSLDVSVLREATLAAEERVQAAERHTPVLTPLLYDEDRAAWERGRRVEAYKTSPEPPVALLTDLRAGEQRQAVAAKLSSLRSSIAMWQNQRGTDAITRLSTGPGLVAQLEELRSHIDTTNEAVTAANVLRRQEFDG